jgi:hypothetical protein
MTMLRLRSHCRGLGLSRRRSRSHASATTFDAVVADGIASDLTFGAPTVTALAGLVVANGVASGLAVGAPTVTALRELIVANGIPSGLAVGAPTVTALAGLVVANGVASGLAVGAPTVTSLRELVVANGIASGLTFGSPTIATAPSIRTQSIQGRAAADPHSVTTSGFGWVAGDLVLAFTGISGTITLSSLAGLTGDTYTQLAAVLPGAHDHRQYLHRGTVNGGAFDSTTRWDLSGSRPIVLALLSIIGGDSTLDASATSLGTGGALPSAPAITTTGPSRLIIAVATIRGAHVTNPPSAPSGYTLLGNAFTAANNPNGTGQSTISVAYKAQPTAGTVAAASWAGLSNIGSQPWETVHIAVKFA